MLAKYPPIRPRMPVARNVMASDCQYVARLTVLGAGTSCGFTAASLLVMITYLCPLGALFVFVGYRARSEQVRVGITYSDLGLQSVEQQMVEDELVATLALSPSPQNKSMNETLPAKVSFEA
jgi:hypothetical protein